MFHPYPRMLFKNPQTEAEQYLIVPDEVAEDRARVDGWGDYTTTPEPAPEKPRRGRRPKES